MNWRHIPLFALSALVLAPLFSGCAPAADVSEVPASPPAETTPEIVRATPSATVPGEAALAAYSAFLSDGRSLLKDAQLETWWIPAFSADSFSYEYTYLDVDGDGEAELLVQMEDDPCGYNGVFHFDGDRLQCWNSDAVEMTCRDYPLTDGTMVRQYDYGGTRSYTLFRYRSDGEREELHFLFARDELVDEDSTLPCPYYEADGTEVDKAEFEARLDGLVESNLLDRASWTALGPREEGP